MQVEARSEQIGDRGPYSRLRPGTLHILDKRSPEGRFLAKERAELTAIAGGKPSIYVQKLIEEAAHIALRQRLLKKKSGTDPDWSERDERSYGAWHDRYLRLLATIQHGRPNRKHEAKDRDDATLADLHELIDGSDG
jgi:hypothetical protein